MKEVGEEETEDKILMWDGEGDVKLKLGEQFTTEQKEELVELLVEYEDGVLWKVPGKTNLAKHKIRTGDATPVSFLLIISLRRIGSRWRMKCEMLFMVLSSLQGVSGLLQW